MTPKKTSLPGIVVLLFFAVRSPAIASAEAGAYSLWECLAIAERNHPSLAGADASIASSRGKLASSVAGDRLNVDGSVSMTRSGAGNGESSRYSAGVKASIKLYDANRSKYGVDAARAGLSAAGEEARHTLLEVRSNVKEAFLALALSYEVERQREDSVEAFNQHLEQAKGFFEAGSKPWYDVTKAEVDLGNAQMSLVEASAGVRNAKASLANAMGLDPGEDFDIAQSEIDVIRALGETADAEGIALENRADYRASALKVNAGRSTLLAEARSNSPTVSLSGGFSEGADDSFDFVGEWNAGVSVSIPILDGGAAKAGIDTASAQIMTLEASREKLRQDILLEASRAQTDIIKARERIRISELTLRNAEENRKLAEGRYETGVGDAMEVTDAILSYTDAILANKQARHDLQVAVVNLERATGVELGAE